MAQLPEHLNTNTNTTSSVIHQKGCLSARQKSTMTIRKIFLNYSLEKKMTWPLGTLGRVLDIRLWSPSGPKGEIGRWTGLQCSTMSFTTPVWAGQWNPGGGGQLVEYICYCSVTTVARQEGKISRADVLKSPNRLWVVVVYISLCWSKMHLGQGWQNSWWNLSPASISYSGISTCCSLCQT